MTHHCIYWNKCSKELRSHICSLIGIRPILNVNGSTYAGSLSPEQVQALKPFVDRDVIKLRLFT